MEEAFEKFFVCLSGKEGIYCKNREKTRGIDEFKTHPVTVMEFRL